MTKIDDPRGKDRALLRVCALACLIPAGAYADGQASPPGSSAAPDPSIQREIAEHRHRLDELRKMLQREQASLEAIEQRLAPVAAPTNSPPVVAAEAPPLPPAAGVDSPQPQAAQPATTPVGEAPRDVSSVPAVAAIFEQPGVLTPKNRFVLEPSLQYSYSSTDRVALLGYTIIPALVVGLIDVREVKSNILTGALTGRYGLTNRLEIETRVPYVYRADDDISRAVGSGAATDSVFGTKGRGLGDVEVAGRYQLNEGSASLPFFVASLRYKTRTGRSPFDVVTDCDTTCVGTNVTGTGLPLSQPTGSGFTSIQPGLTWLLPSDPAVFFGNFSYLHNFRRTVSREVLNGARESLGVVDPGDVIGFNFGMGLALNEKSSFSIGYDQSSVAPAKQDGVRVPGSVRIELGTLVLGYSLRVSPSTTVNLSVGAGLTSDTPGLTLTLRVPLMF